MRATRTVLVLLSAALLMTGTAFADDVQRTDPDACAMFTARLMKSVLGRGATARPERFPLPRMPAADQNLNHFLDVSQTACTWANATSFPKSGLEFVNVTIYQRNDEYSGGGKPWSIDEPLHAYGLLGATAGIDFLDRTWFALKYKTPAINAGNLFILGDHKTVGNRRIWVGVELDDGLWLDIGVAATKRSAISIVGPLLKRVASG